MHRDGLPILPPPDHERLRMTLGIARKSQVFVLAYNEVRLQVAARYSRWH